MATDDNHYTDRHVGGRVHYVYVLECADDTYYTGYTTDVERRVAEHDAGEGAKYTRGRTPVELVHVERFDSKFATLEDRHMDPDYPGEFRAPLDDGERGEDPDANPGVSVRKTRLQIPSLSQTGTTSTGTCPNSASSAPVYNVTCVSGRWWSS